MTCRETKRLVMPYINGSIMDGGPRGFLEHIEICEECREELEIHFTIDVGTHQLDQETGIYNIKGALETVLGLSRQRVRVLGTPEAARYAVNTLRFWTMLAVLVLQFRVW